MICNVAFWLAVTIQNASEAFATSTQSGPGGYGAVFAMLHQRGEWMALKKCLDPANSSHHEALHAEMEALRHIKHPNVVEFRGVVVDEEALQDAASERSG